LAPFVLGGLLNYPEFGDAFEFETGVMSQNELYFAIPVGMWRYENGCECFVECGLLTPYIFVDNAESAAVGKSRFGFLKEMATFGREWGSGRSARGLGEDVQWSLSVWSPSPSGRCRDTLVRGVASRRSVGFLDRDLVARPFESVLRGVTHFAD